MFSSHLDYYSVEQLLGAGEVGLFSKVGFEHEFGDEFLAEDLVEDGGHLGLLGHRAVVLEGQDHRVGARQERAAVDGLNNISGETKKNIVHQEIIK